VAAAAPGYWNVTTLRTLNFSMRGAVAAASDGTIYIADEMGERIVAMAPSGALTTLASGLCSGSGCTIYSIAVGADEAIYVPVHNHHHILRITPPVVAVFAG
jgi:hypothetical protein